MNKNILLQIQGFKKVAKYIVVHPDNAMLFSAKKKQASK